MQLTVRLGFVFAIIALLCGCNSTQTGPAPRPIPTVGIEQLPATGGIATGFLPVGAQQALAIALSGSSDRATAGAQNVFATTTITVNSRTLPQTAARAGAAVISDPKLLARRRREGHPNDFHVMQQLLRRSSTAVGPQKAGRRISASTIPSILLPGSTVAQIWVGKTDIGSDVTTNILAPMTLEAQTPHANIWVINVLLAAGSFSGGAAPSVAAKIGQDFELAYASDTAHFASPDYLTDAPGLKITTDSCDATGQKVGTTSPYIFEPADKRTNLMVIDPTVTGDGVGGYFTATNFATQEALNCNLPAVVKSNEAPMIFVLWSEDKGASFELKSDFITASAHEFQHLINFVNHAIIAPASLTDLQEEESFINEGLSVLAQDLAINTAYPETVFDAADGLGLAATYLEAPQNYSITGFIGIDPKSTKAAHNCSGCYGGAYLLQRYLRDRFGGDAYTQAIETNSKLGFINLTTSCACGESANQLLDDFEIAMGASSTRISASSRADVFGTLDLNGTYILPSVPIGGAGQLSLNGVHAIATSSATVPLGGAAYFALPNPGGNAVTIRDDNTAAGFALSGALVQR